MDQKKVNKYGKVQGYWHVYTGFGPLLCQFSLQKLLPKENYSDFRGLIVENRAIMRYSGNVKFLS